MAEAAGEPAFTSLETFLDTLPTKPCTSQPHNRYFCTVCERVNKAIALRCDFSKVKSTVEHTTEGSASSIQFIPLSETTEKPSDESTEKATEKVEFKVVAPKEADKDYPLFEMVQPKDKRIEPIEMELLENVAIEFKLADDEPIEVEPLEVEPIDESGEGLEPVEVIEVETLEADVMEPEPGETYPEFKPLTNNMRKIEPQEAVRKVAVKVPKKKVGKIPKKTPGMAIKRKPRKPPGKIAKKPVKKVAKKKGVKTQAPSTQLAWEPPQAPPKKRIKPVQPFVDQSQTQRLVKGPAPLKKPTFKTPRKAPKKVSMVKKIPKQKQ